MLSPISNSYLFLAVFIFLRYNETNHQREGFSMLKKFPVKEFLVITLGVTIVAAAVFFFMLPSHVSVGSGTALAMVLSNFIPLPVSAITLILNVFLLILGFLLIGPEFGIGDNITNIFFKLC